MFDICQVTALLRQMPEHDPKRDSEAAHQESYPSYPSVSNWHLQPTWRLQPIGMHANL